MDSCLSSISSPNNGSPEGGDFKSAAIELAKEAALLFHSRNYVECKGVLNQLLHHMPDDPKILHNIAVTESFQDGCSDPKKLLGLLSNIKNRIEELAHASVQHVEGNNSIDSIAPVDNRESIGTSRQFSATNSSTIVYTGEYDISVAMFNMAVIWFHLHEHSKSFSILDVLFQNIIPIDEVIALRICLLLLDVALLSHHASICLDVINYMERLFIVNNLVNQVDNVNTSSQQSTSVPKSAPLSSNSAVNDVSNSDSANSLERSLSRSLSDEALEDEPMSLLSSLDISGRRLTQSCGFQSSSGDADENVSHVELRIKWHLYKFQFLLLTRNLKAAKREVKMAMSMVRGNEHCYPTALYLKSQLEYTRGNYRKSIKLLMASSDRTEVGISSIYYNNLGCIYFRLGKYHTSSVLFSKALKNSSSLQKEKPLTLTAFSQDKSQLIAYNCGVQQMACGKPLLAARCFHVASQILYNMPLLWLHVAECCLMASEMGLLNSGSSASSDKSDIEVHVIGKGKWRELVLKSGPSEDGQVGHLAKECSFLGDDGRPCLSMSLARQCLLNALHLLDSSYSRCSKSGLPSNLAPDDIEHKETISSNNADLNILPRGDAKTSSLGVGPGQVNSNGEVKDQKSGSSQNAYLQKSLSDYKEICGKENHIIRQALLADLAFVELELGNPLKALSVARALLKLDCLKFYSFVGNMYAAEALCLLNRPNEAAGHLSIYLSSEKTVPPPYSQEDCEKWQMDKIVDWEESNGGPADANAPLADESQGFVFLKPEEACGTLYADLALVSALEGDFKQANEFVIQALSFLPNNPGVIRTAIYVDLMLGKAQEALARLRIANRVRLLPSSLRVNGCS